MPTFKDANSKEYTIKFDGVLLSEISRETGVNLADLGGGGYLRIESDASALTQVVALLVGKQLGGLSKEQFAEHFYGESIETALKAIWEAAKVFFPQRRLSVLLSNFKRIQGQWEPMQQAMAIVAQDLPADVKETMLQGIRDGMTYSASLNSAAKPSASGQDASPSSAAIDSPA